jgi:hypothetical protein
LTLLLPPDSILSSSAIYPVALTQTRNPDSDGCGDSSAIAALTAAADPAWQQRSPETS